MTPPPETSMVTSISFAALGTRRSGSAIFMRVVSVPYFSRGTELTLIMPLPAFIVARAIAVLRFPLVFMIFAMVTTLELGSESRADRSERDKLRVVETVHVDFFRDFHRCACKLHRDTDVALDALHEMVRPARNERSPAVTGGTALALVVVVAKNACAAAGDDDLLDIHDRDLFTGKGTLGGNACKPSKDEPVPVNYGNHVFLTSGSGHRFPWGCPLTAARSSCTALLRP